MLNKYQEAINAGYSDQEIAEFLLREDPGKLQEALDAGYSHQEVARHMLGVQAESAPQDDSDQPKGLIGAVKSGLKSTGSMLESAWDVATGDDEGVREAAQAPPKVTAEQEEFRNLISQYGDPDSVWESIKGVAQAAWEEPTGAMYELAAQMPNAGYVMGNGAAGAGIGFVSTGGNPLGMLVGGIAGVLFGNTSIETGAIAQEQAAKGEYDRADAALGGLKKGAVLTAVDTATVGLSKWITGSAGRATTQAVNKIIAGNGVDATNKVAVQSFLKANPKVAAQVEKTVADGLEKSGFRVAAENLSSFGAGTAGEGVGEYYGGIAAGQGGDITNAVLESFMTGPQNIVEVGVGGAMSAIDQGKNQTLLKAKEANAKLAGNSAPPDIDVSPELRAQELFAAYQKGAPDDDVYNILQESPEVQPHFDNLVAQAEATNQEEQYWQAQEAAIKNQRQMQDWRNQSKQVAQDIDFTEAPETLEQAKAATRSLTQENQQQMDRMAAPPDYNLNEQAGLAKQQQQIDQFRKAQARERSAEALRRRQQPVQNKYKTRGQIQAEKANQALSRFENRGEAHLAGDVPVVESQPQTDPRIIQSTPEKQAIKPGVAYTGRDQAQKEQTSQQMDQWGDRGVDIPDTTGSQKEWEQYQSDVNQIQDQQKKREVRALKQRLIALKNKDRKSPKDRKRIREFAERLKTAGFETASIDREVSQDKIRDYQKVVSSIDRGRFVPAEKLREYPGLVPDEQIMEDIRSDEETDFQAKINAMQNEVNGSHSRGVNQEMANRQGETVVFAANSPQWMKNVQQDLKSDGKPAMSRNEFNAIFNRVRKGLNLTEKQQDRYDYIKRQIDQYQGDAGEFAAEEDLADMERRGFEPLGGQDVSVANLNEGDRVIATVDGVKDEYEVKDTNEQGETLLQDGVARRVDMFDQIPVEGLKKASGDDSKFQKAYRETGDDAVSAATDTKGQPKAQEQELQKALRRFEGNETVSTVPASTREQKEVAKVAELFGLKPVFWTSASPEINKLNGFVHGQNNEIYLNANAQDPILGIVGHETFHQLKKNHPDLYEFLLDNIEITEESFHKYADKYAESMEDMPIDGLSYDQVEEELLADFAGDQFKRPEFWQKLHAENPSFTDRIIDIVRKIIDKIRSAFPRGEKYISNFQESQDALAKAMGEASRRQSGGKADGDFKAQAKGRLNTDTKAFRDWFGDSKVVDENGGPLVVYYQTDDAAYNDLLFGSGTFKKKPGAGSYDNETPSGFYFKSHDQDIGLAGTRQIAAYLSIQAPMVFENRQELSAFLSENIPDWQALRSELSFIDAKNSRALDKLESLEDEQYKVWWNNKKEGEDFVSTYERQMSDLLLEWRGKTNSLSQEMRGLVTDFFESSEYDGIILKKDRGGIGRKTTDAYIAFEPSQIKSVDNTGTWDTTNPDIRYQIADNRITEPTDPDLTEKGRKEVDRIMARLRKLGRDPIQVSENKTKKLAGDYIKAKNAAKDQGKDLETRIKDYKDFLQGLPMDVRGKAMKGIVKISRAKTTKTREKYFNEFVAQSTRYLNQFHLREAKARLHRLRKHPRQTKGGEIKKSNLSPEGKKFLEVVNKFVFGNDEHRTKEGRDDKIQFLIGKRANIEGHGDLTESDQDHINTIDLQIEALMIFGGIKDMTLQDVEQATVKLQEVIKNGRTKWREAEEARKRELAIKAGRASQDITGKKEPKPETQAQKKAREDKEQSSYLHKIIRGLSNFDSQHQSWSYLMDKVFGKGKGRTLETKSGKMTSSLVHHATNQEEQNISDMVTPLKQKIMDLSGGKKGRKLAKWINKQSTEQHEYTLESPTGTGPIKLAPLEAAYWWAVNRRGEAMSKEDRKHFRSRMGNMGVSADFIKEVESVVDPEIIELAKWLSDELGERVWEMVNPVHEARFGASLTHTEHYTPIIAEYRKRATDESMESFLQKAELGASMTKGAMHELTRTMTKVKPMNLLEVWTDHIYDMSHFSAWAIPIRQLEGMFSDPEVAGFIEQQHGKAMNSYIGQFLTHFKRGQQRRQELLSWIERWRGKFATAVLGINPTIFYKQLASVGAMADRIPVKDFAIGMADFFTNPVAKAKILNDSRALKTRKAIGHTRDVVRAKRQTLANSIAEVKSLPDQLMLFTRLGDQAAIYTGGWPVYRYYNKMYRKQGMSESKAHKEALMRFEESFKETQQSGEKMDLGLIQQDSAFTKLFTMFMTSQASYYRGTAAAIRNFSKSPMDSIKRIGIFWFLMPAMFEAIASAPLAFGDDEDEELFLKRMGRSVALGPISGLIFARDVASLFYNQLFLSEEAWMSGLSSPVAEPIRVAGSLLGEIRKAIEDGEMDIEDVVNDMTDIASYTTGLPLAQGKKMSERMFEGVEEQNIAKMMGYSDYYTERD